MIPTRQENACPTLHLPVEQSAADGRWPKIPPYCARTPNCRSRGSLSVSHGIGADMSYRAMRTVGRRRGSRKSYGHLYCRSMRLADDEYFSRGSYSPSRISTFDGRAAVPALASLTARKVAVDPGEMLLGASWTATCYRSCTWHRWQA